MTDDLISRQAALDIVFDFAETPDKMYQQIRELPGIDPVKHGTWIWDDEGYHCSKCFYHTYWDPGEEISVEWRYCPYCGSRNIETKMQGGEE